MSHYPSPSEPKRFWQRLGFDSLFEFEMFLWRTAFFVWLVKSLFFR